MDTLTRLNILFDVYGKLLTKRQKEVFTLYYQENLSLKEISELLGITRQGVHEPLKRATNSLEDYEKKLGMAEKALEEAEEQDGI